MITITINAATADEARAEAWALFGNPAIEAVSITGTGEAGTLHTQGETVVAAPAPAKKRGRPAKAAPVAEPVQAITETPEDRQDPEDQELEVEEVEADEADIDDDNDVDIEDDDLVGGYAPTLEGLKAAMSAHAGKFGMAETQKHGPALLGAPKLSAVEDIPAALRRFVGAIASDKAAG